MSEPTSHATMVRHQFEIEHLCTGIRLRVPLLEGVCILSPVELTYAKELTVADPKTVTHVVSGGTGVVLHMTSGELSFPDPDTDVYTDEEITDLELDETFGWRLELTEATVGGGELGYVAYNAAIAGSAVNQLSDISDVILTAAELQTLGFTDAVAGHPLTIHGIHIGTYNPQVMTNKATLGQGIVASVIRITNYSAGD